MLSCTLVLTFTFENSQQKSAKQFYSIYKYEIMYLCAYVYKH